MYHIVEAKDLDDLIIVLQGQKELQRSKLQSEIENIRRSTTTSSILKNVFQTFVNDDTVKTKATSTIFGLGSGLLAQQLVFGKSTNLFKKLLGTLLNIAVTNVVAKNTSSLAAKSVGLGKKAFS